MMHMCGAIMVCHGKEKRISDGERNTLDKDIRVFWQDKGWVDTHIIKDLATRFMELNIKKHEEDEWIILFCDKLSAHLDDEIRKICGDAKVLLCYAPPNMSNSIQSIDVGREIYKALHWVYTG